MKNNLEPRAKIGDVVVVKFGLDKVECTVKKVYPSRFHEFVFHFVSGPNPRYNYEILKNLTTNVSYGE